MPTQRGTSGKGCQQVLEPVGCIDQGDIPSIHDPEFPRQRGLCIRTENRFKGDGMSRGPRDGLSQRLPNSGPGGVHRIRDECPNLGDLLGIAVDEHDRYQSSRCMVADGHGKVAPLGRKSAEIDHQRRRRSSTEVVEQGRSRRFVPDEIPGCVQRLSVPPCFHPVPVDQPDADPSTACFKSHVQPGMADEKLERSRRGTEIGDEPPAAPRSHGFPFSSSHKHAAKPRWLPIGIMIPVPSKGGARSRAPRGTSCYGEEGERRISVIRAR